MTLWVGYPRSYTAGRARPVQFVTLHYTAGSEGPSSAEAGAAYDKTRTDGTSTHYFTDSYGPALQEVPEGDRSHAARYHGNEIGVHLELCGTRQTREQWLDSVSLATLETSAALTREICLRQGLALRRLSAQETRAAYYAAPGSRPTGINDHAAVTAAFPEDEGTHTDVGPGFPWDIFMDLVTGDTMDRHQEAMLTNVDRYLWAGVIHLHETVEVPYPGDDPDAQPATVINQTAVALHELSERLAVLEMRPPVEPAPVDVDALAAALAANPALLAALHDAARAGVDGATISAA